MSGVVKESLGNPLSAATVAVLGSRAKVITSDNGIFRINAKQGDVITVTAVGYNPSTVTLGSDEAALNIVMHASVNSLTDVVVIGYGTQKRRDLTGSIATVDVGEAKKLSTNDITGLLQGRATGVAVNSDGQPGSAPSVRIRGFSTFGGSAPFYVVDGVPVGSSIRDFSPNDIQSISVLKDAAAASIYGAAAANGVIIITTKQGSKNTQMKIDYNGYYGWDKVWQHQDVTNREQYQMLNNESRTNAGLTPFPANDPNNPGYIDSIDTDWQKEGLKNGNRQNHNVSFSGGGNNNTYNVSLDYFDNNGSESIFEVQFALSGGTDYNWTGEPSSAWKTVQAISVTYGMEGAGFSDYLPTRWIYNEYKQEQTVDGKLDPRLLATIASYEPEANSTMAYGREWFNPTDRIYPRKYTRDGLDVPFETTESGINYRVLRYADILLMYAEVLNEMGNTAEAYPYIQQVRSRANLPDLSTEKPNMSQQQMRDQIAHERALEFAIEGQRINDIIRWGWLYDATKLSELKAHDADFNTWTPGNEYLPIPQRELDVNKNLSPNPAN